MSEVQLFYCFLLCRQAVNQLIKDVVVNQTAYAMAYNLSCPTDPPDKSLQHCDQQDEADPRTELDIPGYDVILPPKWETYDKARLVVFIRKAQNYDVTCCFGHHKIRVSDI